jgi:hypothetical protein
VTSTWPTVTSEPSIYDFIRSHLGGSGRLDESALALPDDAKVAGPGGLRWVAGGLDGAMGHHAGRGDSDARAAEAAALFAAAAKRPGKRRLKKLYAAISDDSALEYVDGLIGHLRSLGPDPGRIHELGRWLALTGSDRGAVKIGIALLGVTGLGPDLTVVRTLGAHEEFTLYAAVAISNGTPDSERQLWELAKSVDGWGRIACVERLSKTTDPEIRDWILRTGYRNSIMTEYLAFIAATTGGLVAALRGADVDRELLSAAGEILSALDAGGPAQDMDDYEQGAEAVAAFMDLMAERAETLDDFHAVSDVRALLTRDADWEARAARGWTSGLRERLLAQCDRVLASEDWRTLVAAGLESTEPATFRVADRAARRLGIDTFDLHFERVRAAPLGTDWAQAWNQADDARARRLIALARQQLPLDQIARGPADELGAGPEWRAHNALDWTLQALREHPGLGGDLLLVGLASPVTRNRNMALRALREWPAGTWPDGAREAIANLTLNDPNDKSREFARQTRDASADHQ